MDEGINVVTTDESGLVTVKYGDLPVNKHFVRRKNKILSVCVKRDGVDEVIFNTTDWGEIFDFLMKLIFKNESKTQKR